MVFQIKERAELFKIPNFAGIPNVFFADYLGTENDTSSPISGSWFRIEQGPGATPPKYEYDEVGVVIEGGITLKDESGQTATVKAGDTFFIPRGSTITFSTESHGLAWKCGARLPSKL
ncbi:hypothetical protein PMG11_02163 [Penicillium brasilianum]|uniref:(S)-ureidoglycine aminohydrolase cupin domain-containing protein n=1 Tax=Penicillium brasilianum TaxID=104259 RepID=A0A0F7TGN9_PENBI|nr:hypothetical protein PMG11_02163 [Penicillium brasilianum]